jgi:hypothetical protein
VALEKTRSVVSFGVECTDAEVSNVTGNFSLSLSLFVHMNCWILLYHTLCVRIYIYTHTRVDHKLGFGQTRWPERRNKKEKAYCPVTGRKSIRNCSSCSLVWSHITHFWGWWGGGVSSSVSRWIVKSKPTINSISKYFLDDWTITLILGSVPIPRRNPTVTFPRSLRHYNFRFGALLFYPYFLFF